MTKFTNHTQLIVTYMVFLVLGAILFIFDVAYSEYLFSLGTLLAIAHSLIYALQNRSDDIRTQRLHRLNFIASLFLGVAAYLMFMHNTSWVVFVIIYAALIFFLSFRGNN